MSLIEEYHEHLMNVNFPPSRRVLFEIVRDFTDRRTLRQAWESIDDDIQETILEDWLNLIEKEIHSDKQHDNTGN